MKTTETRVCWNCAAETDCHFCNVCGQHFTGPTDSPAFIEYCRENTPLEDMSREELGAELYARIQAANFDLDAAPVQEVVALIEGREAAAKAEAAAEKAAAEAAAEAALTPAERRIRQLQKDIATETGLLNYSSYTGRCSGIRTINKLRKELAAAKKAA